MRVKIVSVSVETVNSGRKNYRKATVIYTFNGQARTQNVMDFSNPAVFKTVASWEGAPPADEVEVEVGKNAGGFNEWRSIGAAGSTASASSETSSAPTSAPRSGTYQAPARDFETRDERAARQVLIVKQSSLERAVDILKARGFEDELTVEAVTEVAQRLADWVLDNGDNNNV